jgi:hypothetical protein
MPSKHTKKEKAGIIDKCIDFVRQDLAATLRSRTGSFSEMATLLRFKTGTKGFHRQYNKLLSKAKQMQRTFHKSVLEFLPNKGLRIGIFDDSSIKKTGKNFPKQQIHHEHTNNSYYSGMKLFSTAIYQYGKMATISSEIVGKKDNKVKVASKMVDVLVDKFDVDIMLFDSWYCTKQIIDKVIEHHIIFVSRLKCNSKAIIDEKTKLRLDEIAKSIPHKQYAKIKVKGKSYWIYEMYLNLEAYGHLRVIFSKEAQYDEPIFLATNTERFTAKFIVKLYLKRFSIEVYFKDAKQFLNLETFFCRPAEKWNLHLLLTNILHWCIQRKKSISKAVRRIRENMGSCLLFINENWLLGKFFEGLRKKCQT